jgi:hypothetical protein
MPFNPSLHKALKGFEHFEEKTGLKTYLKTNLQTIKSPLHPARKRGLKTPQSKR